MLAVHIANDRAASAVLALYTDDRQEADRALASMTEALHGQAVDVQDAVQVSAAGYVDMHAPAAVVRPLSDVTSSVLAAEMVALGVAPVRDRAGLLPAEARPEAQATARRAAEKHAAKSVDEQTTHALATWRLALTGLVGGPGVYGELAQMLTHTKVRDAALLSMVAGVDPDTVTETAAGNAPDEATGRAVAAIVDPKVGERPGAAADAAADLLAQIVAHVPHQRPCLDPLGPGRLVARAEPGRGRRVRPRAAQRRVLPARAPTQHRDPGRDASRLGRARARRAVTVRRAARGESLRAARPSRVVLPVPAHRGPVRAPGAAPEPPPPAWGRHRRRRRRRVLGVQVGAAGGRWGAVGLAVVVELAGVGGCSRPSAGT